MSEERRVVTILFSDVTGSTAMGEANDPEDVRALLGRYYAIAREVITAHGGTLEKFIGDAVMAVFGIPQAHGDDAERALVADGCPAGLLGGDESRRRRGLRSARHAQWQLLGQEVSRASAANSLQGPRPARRSSS